MKDIFQTFVIELWYLWVGIIGALIYYFIKSFRQLRNWIGHPDGADLRGTGYHNLADMINLTINNKIDRK